MYFWFFKCVGLFVGFFGSALVLPSSADPLLLTPLIESNRTEEARNQSQVRDLPYVSEVLSYSGYLTVNNMSKHHLFFWYFPAMEADPAKAPVILWLSGGPGWSGLNGLFVENGPFIVDANGNVTLRNETWNKQFSVVFVDQPVGTGFSYADSGNDTITGDVADIVTQDMVEFVQQFLCLYELEQNDFYISGQSYGGKYTTRLATALLNNSTGFKNNSINLKGITIGNGFIDSSYATNDSDFLYQHGLITSNQKKELEEMQDTLRQYLQNNAMIDAANLIDAIMLGYFHQPTFIENCTGDSDPSNFMSYTTPKSATYFLQYVSRKDVRTAMHVSIDRAFSPLALNVAQYTLSDFPVSVLPQLFKLVNDFGNLKILVYNGELDLLCPYVITEQIFLNNLDSFANASRIIWKVNPSDLEVAGFVTQPTSKLWVTMVRGGGHSAPQDEPQRCLDLVTRFINDVPIQSQSDHGANVATPPDVGF